MAKGSEIMQDINPWLPRFAGLLVASTFCLIFLGGMVTSMNAGLSVPDWPTSYGYNMFTFPIEKWVGGVFFEHTHRLLASCVGLMTTILVAWIWRNRFALPVALAVMAIATAGAIMTVKTIPALAGPEHSMTRGLIVMHVNIWSFATAFVVTLLTTDRARRRDGRPWLRWLGFGAFLLVCIQGTLGGLRVTEVSIVLAMIHACTAQAFMCLTVIMAAALSQQWQMAETNNTRRTPAMKGLAWALVGAIYCQLVVGAVVRHLHAGLSIPDFPLSLGYVIPPMLNERIAIHFAHRIGALIVTILTAALVITVFRKARGNSRLARAATGLIGVVVTQIALGASVIWLRRDPLITSLHVLNGAAVLGMALLLAMRISRLPAMARKTLGSWAARQGSEVHA